MTEVATLVRSEAQESDRIDFSRVWGALSEGGDPQGGVRDRLSSTPDYAQRVRLFREMAAGALLPHIAPMFGVRPGQPPADEGVRRRVEDLSEIAASTIGANPSWVQDSSRRVSLEALMRVAVRKGDYAAVRDEMLRNPEMLGAVAELARDLANSDKTEAYANSGSIFNKFGLSINPNK